jgi:hypothetical protein
VARPDGQGLRTKSLKNQIGDAFSEAEVQGGALSFAAQGPFSRAGFKEFGGDLTHHGQVLGRRPVADLAVVLMTGDIQQSISQLNNNQFPSYQSISQLNYERNQLTSNHFQVILLHAFC